MSGLFGQAEVRITRLRGSWMDFHGTPVMPIPVFPVGQIGSPMRTRWPVSSAGISEQWAYCV